MAYIFYVYLNVHYGFIVLLSIMKWNDILWDFKNFF